ncbi:UNVERIFIED_CONTAM: hypothetical protein Sindi_2915600, partial [Sesamum indicum]
MAKSKKAKQQADASTAGQPKTAGPPPAADEPAQSTKPATKQGTTTAAGKVSTMAFNEFISDMEATPSHIAKNAAAIATDNRPVGKLPVTENVEKKPVSFAGLFSANRKLTNEHKLTKFAVDDGPLTLVSDDLLDVRAKLGFCLVGYVAGKFPGLKVIRTLAQSWGASFQQHESGWLVFRFAREEDRQRVLAGGPYFVYGRPLLLKHMPDCFEFKEDDISLTPVWATLPSLPLECWHPNALGKIGSRIGTPIAMDSLTMNMERVSYARILVEVDASKKLIEQVEFVMPNGITRKQPVIWAFARDLPRPIGHCPHSRPSRLPTPVAAPIKPAEAAKSKPGDWMVVNRRSKGKATATAAKPAVETQRPTSPPARQGGTGTAEYEGTATTNSDSSSSDSPTATHHEMPGIITDGLQGRALTGLSNTMGSPTSLRITGFVSWAFLETKLAASSIQTILSRSLPGWCQANNFDTIAGGRILVVWDPAIIDIHPVDISPQVIHCRGARISPLNSPSIFHLHTAFILLLIEGTCGRNFLILANHGTCHGLLWGISTVLNLPMRSSLEWLHLGMSLRILWDCCTALGLHDVPTTGCYYTWYSNNESNPVWCKLDRVLCNNAWLEGGLHCSAHFNPPGCLSDHSPGIVSILDPAPTKPKSFRFFNMWADHPDFLATVEAKWNLSVDGTAQFCLCKRLKALKGELKAFNSQHYSHISARAKEADHTLQVAQNQLESNPGDVALRNSLGDLRKRAVFLAEAERQFFYQKAKIHYLKDGDRNTKFFHDMVKRNVTKNSIGAVTRADGTVITAAEDIAQEFVDYYTSLLGTEAHTLPVDDGVFEWGPILSPEQTADLCRAVTPLEVKEAIFHISDNKAPGPDGYSS